VESPDFKFYTAALGAEVGRCVARRAIGRDWAPSRQTIQKTRGVAKKAATLLEQIHRLGPQDRSLLQDIGCWLGSDNAGRRTDPPRSRNWRRQLLFAFLSARTHPRPAWLLEFTTKLERLLLIAQAAERLGESTRRGRKPDAARILFGRKIASIYYIYLKRRPTTGRNSAFEKTLRLCLNAAGEHVGDKNDPEDLHALAASVLDGMQFARALPNLRLVP
jgi:hypothetical protein